MTKDKFFSLRLTQTLADRVESAKGYFGGKISTGEAVRQLLERGLDQINQQGPETLWSLQQRPREALLRILSKRSEHMTLSHTEWTFLAELAHRAYRASGDHRDRVARDLLVDNFRAFTAVIEQQKLQSSPRRDDESDRRYMGNFGIYGDNIEACTEEAIAALPLFPSPFTAEHGSGNLYHALAHQPVDATDLHPHLEPYLGSLLQVALRGYFIVNETSVFDDPTLPSATKRVLNGVTLNCQNDHFCLSLSGLGRELIAQLSFNEGCSTMDLNSYVELTEFADLVWTAVQSDDGVGVVRSNPFILSWRAQNEDREPIYRLTDERVQWRFPAEKVRALGNLLRDAVSVPEMCGHMERLTFVYGRI